MNDDNQTGLEQIKGLLTELIEMRKSLALADYKKIMSRYDLPTNIQNALNDAFEEGYNVGAKCTRDDALDFFEKVGIFDE